MSTGRSGPGAHKGGGIVNLSSAAATLGSPGEFTWYAASKGAVDSFTIGLAKEVGGEGIRVNAVAPGLIETGIHDASGIERRLEKLAPGAPLGRAGRPEEVAEPILWLLSEEASYISGAILRIGGGR
jgi:NAD(P)-dependent dehydrogenase (short-subunit alcohol dehydrogenase family)